MGVLTYCKRVPTRPHVGLKNEQTVAELKTQIDLMFYRFPKELEIYDQYMKAQPDQKVRLLAQRLKFVGHFLENAQKMSMIGVYKPNNLQVRLMQGAMDQLVPTVRALQQSGVFNSLYNLKANDPQLYRDIIGDSAHAPCTRCIYLVVIAESFTKMSSWQSYLAGLK